MDFNNINFDLPKNKSASIKVIGVGGGGGNAVNYMFEQGITGVDFVIANTDNQALHNSSVPIKVQLGASITEGLGAGANPEIGEQAALESMDDIKNLLDVNTKMLFITAGMGGGTGTGAAPVIASIAKDMGILTVGICTAPFYFEGKMRVEQAKLGIEKLRANVDSLIIINNDKLRELYGNLSYKTGFAKADEVLATAAKGIAEVITHHYSTNIDLRDAKTVLADSGTAIMGSARAHGDEKARKAIELALDSPLLNDNKITGAKNVLLLIVSGSDEVTMDEIGTINDYIQNEAGHNANIIMGIGEDEELGEDISITVIATGFPIDQQDFNGQEDQQIVHTLDDIEEPLTDSFSLSKAKVQKTPKVNLGKTKVEDELETNAPQPELGFKESFLEEEEDEFLNFEVRTETRSTLDIQNENYHSDRRPAEKETPKFENKEVKNLNDGAENKHPKNKADNYTILTLDEEWKEEVDKPISINNTNKRESIQEEETLEPKKAVEPTPVFEEKIPSVEKEVIADNLFEEPISENIRQQIQERRDRLKRFNFKFKTRLDEKDAEEMEKIPAYKRNQIELSEHKREKTGNYIIDRDTSNDIKIRPNNFLHDNVD